MSRKLVTLRTVTAIEPIENADNIELALIDGWECVVKKGEFKPGDAGLYFEIDSLVPFAPWSKFLFKDTREYFRIKTIKLRGKLSQGLLLRPDAVFGVGVVFDKDYAEELGVKKFEPALPKDLKIEGSWPSFLAKTDEERVQNMKLNFPIVGASNGYDKDYDPKNIFEISEKLDGTSSTYFVYEDESGEFVSGICSRNFQMKEDSDNSYTRMNDKFNIIRNLTRAIKSKKFNQIKSDYNGICIQGEILGPGIQKNKYALNEELWFPFTMYAFNSKNHKRLYLDKYEMITIWAAMNLDYAEAVITKEIEDAFDTEISRLCDTMFKHQLVSQKNSKGDLVDAFVLNSRKEILEFAEGKSILNPNVEREGIVFVRSKKFLANEVSNNRFSFKAISNKFLLKHNDE